MNNIKNDVKEKIIEYSNDEYFDDYIKHEFLTENGDANIYIRLFDKDELFDKHTFGHQLELKHDIYDFLDEKSSMLNNDIQLNFHIVGLKLSSDEKEDVKHLVKEHYAIELYKIQKVYKRYRNKIYILVSLGLMFMLLYYFISLYFESVFFIEAFGFLFSFALWVALESLIFDLSEIKINRESITQKLLINFEFNNNKMKEE